MGRISLRAAAVITLAALFAGTATASYGAVPEEVKHPVPIDSPAGQLHRPSEGRPARHLRRRRPGPRADQARRGRAARRPLGRTRRSTSRTSRSSRRMSPPSRGRHARHDLPGRRSTASAADLSGGEVAKLRGDKDVLGVFPDEIRHPDAVPSTEFLGLGSSATGKGGVWEATGGVAEAGKGVVVGVVDTGIAPENPSFAGRRARRRRPARSPTVDGDTIVFDKADGGQFRSEIVIGAGAGTSASYSTKLIGAQYFLAGARRRASTSSTTSCRRATATGTARTPRAPRPATSA